MERRLAQFSSTGKFIAEQTVLRSILEVLLNSKTLMKRKTAGKQINEVASNLSYYRFIKRIIFIFHKITASNIKTRIKIKIRISKKYFTEYSIERVQEYQFIPEFFAHLLFLRTLINWHLFCLSVPENINHFRKLTFSV